MKKETVKIAVLQRGWVFVGIFSQEGENCKLTEAYNIRNWGTTKGLGEIVDGPLKTTILDRVGTVSFHELSAIALLDCSDSWMGKLKIQEMNK